MTKEQQRQVEANIKQMGALYGENHVLEVDPDPSHSIKCANGTFVPKMQGTVRAFRGIPFALPPVGERRWKKPEPTSDGNEVREAYFNAKSPIQTQIFSERASCYPQSEDCLYLNIWINDACAAKNKPIMVFIHGGSYGWGGTADPLYDGYNFVSLNPDIILITIAYRTGILGFLDLSYLKGGEDFPDAPNLGLLDQIEALRWIQKNGAALGGDIHNVTVFGESAGGGSVSILPIMKEAKRLFKRVIAESGSLALTYSKEECKELTDRLIKEAKSEDVYALMALSEEEISKLNQPLNDYNNFPMRDGRYIPLDPYEPYRNGETKDIDMIFGTNANEMHYWIGELGGLFQYCLGMPIKFKGDVKTVGEEDKPRVKEFMKLIEGNRVNKVTEFYNETMFRLPAIVQAEAHAKNGGNMYMYYWQEESKIDLYKACHAVELAYVFYNIEDTVYTGEKADEGLARQTAKAWASFARSGDPSCDGIEWKKYDGESRNTMTIQKEGWTVVSDPLQKQRELLTPVVKYMINPGLANVDLDMSLFTKTKSLVNASFNAISFLVSEKKIS
ncbi:MAG: carboxylesterase family protein [Bacilli bacterium]|nr:carboxylesterase family protein [Bacilli bacterium]